MSRNDSQTRRLESGNSPATMPAKPLTIKELRAYPESTRKVVLPPATAKGHVTVGRSRKRAFKLYYEKYGTGSARVVWLNGQGEQITSCHRFIRHFCLPNSDKYTNLFIQNRGIKESEGPFGLWTTKDLAHDAADALVELGWTEPSSVHIVGHSMGGMVAQELAIMSTKIVASLILVSTSSHYLRDKSFLKSARDTVGMMMPRSEDDKLAWVKAYVFGPVWLEQPDVEGLFPTNGDNWAARDYLKNGDDNGSMKGGILQTPACLSHKVDPETLRLLAKQVGGHRIQILHGRSDNIIPFIAGERLLEAFGGTAAGVGFHTLDATGHGLPHEHLDKMVEVIEDMVART